MASKPEKLAYNREYRTRNRERLRAAQKAYRQANRDRIADRNRGYRLRAGRDGGRIAWLRDRHGLRPEDWAQMSAAQDECCYLCGRPLGDRVVVDHDHSHCRAGYSCQACRRGLAHDECNTAIGLLRDDPDCLRRVADALELARKGVTQRIAAGEQLCLDEGVI